MDSSRNRWSSDKYCVIHQPNNVVCSPHIFGKTISMEEHLNLFNNGAVVSFCNTIILRGMVNGELLACTL
jgi:hypothetical protein